MCDKRQHAQTFIDVMVGGVPERTDYFGNERAEWK